MRQTGIAVIGAGLAGLAAAATAAELTEAPATASTTATRVLVLDEKSPGGRARTDVEDEFRFNRGPHAIYLRGAGHRVLNRLGVRPAMHTPPLRGARLMSGGQPWPAVSRRVLGARAAAQLAGLLLRISRLNPADYAGISARDWIDGLDLTPRAAALLAMLVRVSTYVAEQDRMSADIAIGQLRLAAHGVGYPDEGWQSLVAGLQETATNRGAVVENSPVTAVTGEPGAWRVVTLSGEEIIARAVIVAAGTPAAARAAVPVPARARRAPGPGGQRHGARDAQRRRRPACRPCPPGGIRRVGGHHRRWYRGRALPAPDGRRHAPAAARDRARRPAGGRGARAAGRVHRRRLGRPGRLAVGRLPR
jgi:phytoene dehydrogenase-like protein